MIYHINWVGYYPQFDGYGRFSSRMVQALQKAGMLVKPATMDSLMMPSWMQEQEGLIFNEDALTISCLPPYYLKDAPGRHWLYTMVEGSAVPEEWVEIINKSKIERLVVPCLHNLKAYKNSGVNKPISVVQGGTDPDEFPRLLPYHQRYWNEERPPYTFLTLADRGFRKGWNEVWDAFYIAFGGKTTGIQNVRVLVKTRKKDDTTTFMEGAEGADKRISYNRDDVASMKELYSQVDCVVIPSRCEGWGMPHREAACMGLPVITQAYAGLDDGDTEKWAMVVQGKLKDIPKENKLALGQWQIADVNDLAQKMIACFHSPETASLFGQQAALWLRQNQTWKDSAKILISLIGITDAIRMERTPV